MDFTPQLETREIAEDELDMVSGGIGDLNLAPMTEVGDLVDLAAPVTGSLGQITGSL